MLAMVLHGVRDLRAEDRPVPEPGPGEVRVKVTAVGVCGSDVHYFETGRIGRFVVDRPLVLGHEVGGIVDAVGSGVSSVGPGERVAIEPGVPCRRCQRCLAGRYNLCAEMRFFGTPPVDGAFCEYVVMPAEFIYPISDRLSDDAAALIEPLSVGLWACQRAGVAPGSSVLVTGAGPIGLLTAQVARASGAARVIVTDVVPARLAVAAALGFDTIDVRKDSLSSVDVQLDVLLECSGSAEATADGLATLSSGGRAVLVGMGGDTVTLPLSTVQERELSVTGTFRYANTWPTAIALAENRSVDLDRIVTGHYSLGSLETALTAMQRDPATIKSIVSPEA